MKKHLFLFSLLIAAQSIIAQTQHFWSDVQTIKNFDKIYQSPKNPIVFVGSSSIRKWEGLQVAFGKKNILNRGIGGAKVNDIIFYLDDIVFPYNPRQIVIYVGENDLVDDASTTDTIVNRTVKLYRLIRAKLPTVPIAYLAIKPSPSRDQFQSKAKQCNFIIKSFLANEPHTTFIDVFTPMLENGKSRPELFVQDQLHLNEKGYKIWEEKVRPHLVK